MLGTSGTRAAPSSDYAPGGGAVTIGRRIVLWCFGPWVLWSATAAPAGGQGPAPLHIVGAPAPYDLWAVVIGLAHYRKDKWQTPRYTADSAMRLYKALTEPEGSGGGYDASCVYPAIYDRPNLKTHDLLNERRWWQSNPESFLQNSCAETSTALYCFVGHGVTDQEGDEILIHRGAGSMLAQEDRYDLPGLLKSIKAFGCRALVVIDACAERAPGEPGTATVAGSDPDPRGSGTPAEGEDASPPPWPDAKGDVPENVVLITACDVGERAKEHPTGERVCPGCRKMGLTDSDGYAVLTRFLIEGLERSDEEPGTLRADEFPRENDPWKHQGDGRVTACELYGYAKHRMERWSEVHDYKETLTPQLHAKHDLLLAYGDPVEARTARAQVAKADELFYQEVAKAADASEPAEERYRKALEQYEKAGQTHKPNDEALAGKLTVGVARMWAMVEAEAKTTAQLWLKGLALKPATKALCDRNERAHLAKRNAEVIAKHGLNRNKLPRGIRCVGAPDPVRLSVAQTVIGTAALVERQWHAAHTKLEEAVTADSRNFAAQLNLAVADFWDQSTREAVNRLTKQCQDTSRFTPGNGVAFYDLGLIYFRMAYSEEDTGVAWDPGLLKRARDQLSEATLRNPSDLDGLHFLKLAFDHAPEQLEPEDTLARWKNEAQLKQVESAYGATGNFTRLTEDFLHTRFAPLEAK